MKTKPFLLLFVTLFSLLTSSGYVCAQKTSLVRVHENMRETPFPQSFHTPYLNPTPLLVPREMRKGEFLQFELSIDKTFPVGNTLTSKPLPWCMFNPHQVLSNNTWYWRFRSVTKDGTSMPWSETYNFTITDEIPKFVTPTFDDFFKNLPTASPRLYCFLNEDITKARKSIETHPEYKELVRRAQMGLDFTYDAAKPFDAVGKAGVLFCHLHTAYALTGNEQYADKMTEYVRALLKATPNEKLFKNDFYAGDLLYILTHTYDICNDRLTDAERQQTKQLVLKAAQGHHWTQRTGYVENHIFDNHYWQRAFREMLQVGLLFANEDNQAKEVLEYCYELWTARAPASGFNRDGEWHNGHGYFDANLKTLYYVPSLLSHIAKNDFLQHPWYQKAGQALVYTWAPQSKSAGFGDGSEKGVDPNRQRVAFADFLARETGDMYSGWYANQCSNTLRQDLDLRLYRMASLHTYPTDLPQDAPKFVWYKDAGELAMHSHLDAPEKDLTLGFRSSTFGSGSHTLSNQNAFNLLFRGVDVYRSSGYYLNFSDAHNLMSYRHTRAHNTILVNGIGQPYSTKGYGNIVRVLGGKHITYCLGDASKAYSGITDDPMWIASFQAAGIEQTPANGFGSTPLTKYRRHVVMLHPDNIVLLYDELEASEPVRWEWLLHSPTRFYIENSQQMASTANADKGFNTVTQLFSQQSFDLSQTDRFVVPPTAVPNPQYPNQWHLTATFNGVSATRILTVIQVAPAESQVRMVRRNGNTLQCGDWSIEAELDASLPAALRINNRKNEAVLSYGSENPSLGGEVYPREHAQSSLLYDESEGEYRVMEQTDYLPASTRAVK